MGKPTLRDALVAAAVAVFMSVIPVKDGIIAAAQAVSCPTSQ